MRGTVGLLVVALSGCEHGSSPAGDGPVGGDGTKLDTILGDAFACGDDSAFEPNDSIATAFVTPVANQAATFTALAAICPMNDHDNYEINLSTPSTLRITTSWTGGDPVISSMLNQGGTSLGNSVAMGTDAHCVCENSLPAGIYFASVSAASGVENNYRIEIELITTGDCTSPPACN